MRQRNGEALFGANDPRGAVTGIIEVAPEDDRQSILTAILTQEQLDRKQTVLVLPTQCEAFRRPVDFKEFAGALHDLQTELVFVLPANSSLTRLVRQHEYPVFASLENYVQYARRFLNPPSVAPPSNDEEPTPDVNETSSAEPIVAPVVPAVAPTEAERPTTPLVTPQQAPPDEEDEDLDETEEATIPASPIPPRASLFRHPSAGDANGEAPSDDDDEQEASSVSSPTAQPSAPATGNSRRPRRLWTLVVLLLIIILLLGGVLGTLLGVVPVAVLFPGITSAIVTITPDSQQFQQPYQITAVTTQADETQRQVQARFLSATTAPQTKTVAASGTGSYPAQHALGALTFYNALPEAQNVPKGTVVTDNKGIQVISDEDALVPGAQPPQEGMITVQAHAVQAGAKGNTFQLTGTRSCCRPGISVKNEISFHDGQDARGYTYVQQSDIDAASSTLTASVLSAGQNALKSQMSPGERLVGDLQCLPDTATNHAAGEQAKTVTVTVQITCTGEAYDQQEAQQLAEFLLKADVEKRIGLDYALQNHISATLNSAQKKDASGTLQLQITAAGLWSYQFHDEQKQAFARLVAGQKANQAVTTLLQQRGVRKAKIDLTLAYDNTLPGNPHQIRVIWQSLT